MGSVLRGLGVGLLVTILILILGWAVIGKHRLDPQARAVYKATRLIVAMRAVDQVPAPDLEPLCLVVIPSVPETPELLSAATRHSVERPKRGSRARSSRAPPSA